MTLLTESPGQVGPSARSLELAWRSPKGLVGFLTAVNHKQIGRRFIFTAIAFLLIGGVEGLLVRLQLSSADNTLLDPQAYNQLFTMHGTTMMFLFAVPVLEGMAMYFAPLLLGTRDLPFPRLNAFGYWIYLAGGIFLNVSFFTGSVPDGGWFAYTPLTGPEFSPTRALDFWLLGVTMVEIAGIVGALELIVLVLKHRAPGMSLGRLPLFVWSVLVMAAMMLIAFPVIVSASLMLEIERKFGAPFYDPGGGGNPLLWQHLFWIFGHPDVYILLLPATGVVSAVVAAHVGRRVVAYPLVAAAMVAIGIASFGLWVHHMFVVGLPMLVLSFFAVASYFITLPSGVQVFAWIATIWEGRPRWDVPLLFVGGAVFIFVLGGITGVMVATAPFDAQAHDSFFVVAHMHYVLIGGVLFPVFAGLHHWIPKMTGRLASETAGKVAFWVMVVGFNVTFFPQHWLGLQGMPRRVYTYFEGQGWQGSNLVSTVGAFVLAAGVAVFVGNLVWAAVRGRPSGPDPWRGDTLEWATDSPPAVYNFQHMPMVGGRSPMWDDDHHGFDPETAQAVSGLSRAHRGRREVLRTSVLDARPESVVSLPGPSIWPLLAAASIAVSLAGVLVDWWFVAAVGAAATLVAVAAWLISNRREPPTAPDGSIDDDGIGDGSHGAEEVGETGAGDAALADARDAADRHFTRSGGAGIVSGVWGTVVALVAVATVMGSFIFSYFYLSLGDDPWPPPGTEPFPLGRSAVALALLGPALASQHTAWRAARGHAARSALAGVLGSCFLVLQAVDVAGAGLRVDRHAYDAMALTIQTLGLLTVASAVAVALSAAWVSRHAVDVGAVRVATVAWWGVSLIWAASWAVLYLFPRVA